MTSIKLRERPRLLVVIGLVAAVFAAAVFTIARLTDPAQNPKTAAAVKHAHTQRNEAAQSAQSATLQATQLRIQVNQLRRGVAYQRARADGWRARYRRLRRGR